MLPAGTIEDIIVAEVAATAYHPRTSKHSDTQSLVIHLRNSLSDLDGLEALGVVVIEHDNLNFLQGKPHFSEVHAQYGHLQRPTQAAKTPPALRVGDPLHYSTMIQRICNAYNQRFC